jgi:hypothetical protein
MEYEQVDSPNIIIKPSIFTGEPYKAVALEGSNLKDILGPINMNVYHVYLNEDRIFNTNVVLKHQDFVTVYGVAAGGGDSGDGKQTGIILAQIAILALAIASGGAAAAAMGLTAAATPTAFAVVSSLVTAGIGIIGNYLLGQLIVPELPEEELGSSNRPSISGQKNSYRINKGVPKVYGTYRYGPPLAAHAYSSWDIVTSALVIGNKGGTYLDEVYGQYLTGLLCVGYGPLSFDGNVIGFNNPTDVKKIVLSCDKDGVFSALKILNDDTEIDITSSWDKTTVKIGATNISNYSSWMMEIARMSDINLYKEALIQENYSIEFEQHSDWDNTRTPVLDPGVGRILYSQIIDEDEETDMKWPGVDVEVEEGMYEVRTTSEEIDNVTVELSFYTGCYDQSNEGASHQVGAEIWVFHAPAGTLPSDGKSAWTLAAKRTVWDNKKDPFQVSIPIVFDSVGQYEIMTIRIGTWIRTQDYYGDGGSYWTNLYTNFKWIWMRSYKTGVVPVQSDDFVLMSYKLLATDQLSGNINTINVLVSSYLDTYTTAQSSAVKQVTSNPAWVFLDVLVGSAQKTPIDISRINLDSLVEWANWCETNGIEYNWVELKKETVLARLRSVAGTGFASWNIVEGKYGVVRDEMDKIPSQMITPRNSWGFASSKSFADVPHAFKVKYIDESKWEESTQIVYDDEYNVDGTDGKIKATLIEELESRGVTKYDQAYRYGRYHLAVLQLRPEIYKLTIDAENLVATRGDVVLLSHDVLLVGMKSGRIKHIDPNVYYIPEQGGPSMFWKSVQNPPLLIEFQINPFPEGSEIILFSDVNNMASMDGYTLLINDGDWSFEKYTNGSSTTIEDWSEETPTYFRVTYDEVNERFSIYTSNDGITWSLRHSSQQGQHTNGNYYGIQMSDTIINFKVDENYIYPSNWTSVEPYNFYNETVITSDEQLANDGTAAAYGVVVRSGKSTDELNSFHVIIIDAGIEVYSFKPGINYAETFDLNVISVGDLFVFGEFGKETIRAKITEVQFSNDFTAELTLVDESPAIANAHTDEIPPYDPGITDPIDPSSITPPIPEIVTINSNSATLYQDNAGNFLPSFTVVFKLQNAFVPIGKIQLKYFPEGSTSGDITVVETTPENTFVRIKEVTSGTSYVVRLRSVSSYGTPSEWTAPQTVTVIGKEYPPSNVTNFTATENEGGVLLSWSHILDVDKDMYEIRQTAEGVAFTPWDSAPLVWRGRTDNFQINNIVGDSIGWGIKAIDTSGNYSNAAANIVWSRSYSNILNVQHNFILDKARLIINANQGSFPIYSFILKETDGAGWNDSTLIQEAQSDIMEIYGNWTGEKEFQIRAKDVFGNLGDIYTFSITIIPTEILTISDNTLDNNVLLSWTAQQGSLDIKFYRIKKGTEFATAQEIGTSNSTFTTQFEIDGGAKTYWIVAVDLGNNEGTPKSIVVEVTEPPGYQLVADWISDYTTNSPTMANCLLDTLPDVQANPLLIVGSRIQPAWTWTTAWGFITSIIGAGTDTPQEKIDSGYPHYLTPGGASNTYYEEKLDYGVVISGSTIQMIVKHELLNGTGNYTITPKISVSEDDVTYTEYENVYSIFARAFRYVKYRLDFSFENDKQLVAVTSLRMKLNVQVRSYSGQVSSVQRPLDESDLTSPTGGLLIDPDLDSKEDKYMKSNATSSGLWSLSNKEAFTIEWIGAIMTTHPDTNSNNKWALISAMTSGGTVQWAMGVKFVGENIYPYVEIFKAGSVYGTSGEVSSKNIPKGRLIHLAAVWNKTTATITIYLNGSLYQTLSLAGPTNVNTGSNSTYLFVGAKSFAGDSADITDGMYILTSEVRVYDDDLSAGTIASRYDKPLAGSESNLVSYFRFHEVDSDYEVADEKGTTEHLDYVGAGNPWPGVWVPTPSTILDIQNISGTISGLKPDLFVMTDFKDVPNPRGFVGVVWNQSTSEPEDSAFTWQLEGY